MSVFGEISEPSSRATWEDWDDVEHGLPELRWQKPLETLQEVETFFLFEGRCLWNSMRTKKNTHEINCIKDANLYLYKIPETNQYICVIRDCDLLLCNDVVKLLKKIITKSKTVVTVQEKSMSEYQSMHTHVDTHLIRKVTTTNTLNLMKEQIQKLEQPNIISGVSAGVFTLRELLNLSATAVVIYMEHSQEYQIEGIQNLLHKLHLSETTQIKPNMVLTSNLYI